MASKTKEIKALERLTGKLSALRKTLRGDERKALDAMVLGASSEVSAHAAAVKVSPGKTAAKNMAQSEVATHAASVRGAKTPAKTLAQTEVAMHAAKVSPSKTSAKTMAHTEVAMHAASVRGAQTDAKATAKVTRVILDPKTGTYGVVVD